MDASAKSDSEKLLPFFVELAEIKIALTENLSATMKSMLASGEYEREELSIVQRTLELNDRVLEIGTGIGLIASFCARKIGSENVFTFEANPELEPLIRTTFSLNNVSPQLQMCLLSESEGEELFNIAEDFWSSSTREFAEAENVISVMVPKRLFNKELERIKPSYLIIDIEGGEYDLLLQSKLPHVSKILLELHTFFIGRKKAEEILSHLNECGFRINRKVTYADSPSFSKKRRFYEYARHRIESSKAMGTVLRSIEKLRPDYSDVFHGNVYLER